MTSGTAAFVDTTIHVDRVIRKHETDYMSALERACESYDVLITSSFSKLEFKNVVLVDLQCVAKWIEEENSFVSAYNRATRVQSRKSKTLTNIVAFVQRSVDTSIEVKIGDSVDKKYMEQALEFIYTSIEYLWYRFDRLVDKVLDDTKCRRVQEVPERKKNGKVMVRNHTSKCLNQTCNISGVFQSHRPRIERLVTSLQALDSVPNSPMTNELREIVRAWLDVADNPTKLCDFNRCVGLGDLWIHLEAIQNGACAVITRNKKESSILCERLGLDMADPSDPKFSSP